jgi:hypothetical protein
MQNSEGRIQNEAIEVAGLGGSKLVVEFGRCDDRLGHVVSLVGREGRKLALLESVEGTPHDDWPASPPLQELSIETLSDGRRVAFLVGRAGGSHWSASVEALADRDGLAFDVACRHGANAGWLGSRYRLLAELSTSVAVEGEVVVTAEGQVMSVRPREPSAAAGTTRWRYLVRVNNDDEDGRQNGPVPGGSRLPLAFG